MVWDYPDKDGETLRQQVENLKTQNLPMDLSGYPQPPEVPYGGEFVWDLFWNLRNGIGGNGFSPSPISYLELQAYIQVTGLRLSPFMVDAVRYMDAKYMEQIGKK